MLVYGLIATVLVTAVVTGVTATLHRGRDGFSARLVLVVAFGGAWVGLGLSFIGDEPWQIWRAVVLETVVAVLGVIVAVGRGSRGHPRRA